MEIEVHKSAHSPLHIFMPNTLYMVTASTFNKCNYFCGAERLFYLQKTLMEIADSFAWNIRAWSILANHYHFIAQSPDDAGSLKRLVQKLHAKTALEINRQDCIKGRRVWYQYWDTCITYEKSYYARLNYVHNNPLKHGLVKSAEDYQFCSARWFREHSDPEIYRQINLTPYNSISVRDDF